MIMVTVDEKMKTNLNLEKIKEFSKKIIKSEKVAGKNYEAHLIFVDTDGMKNINNIYRNENTATDVISLPLYGSKKEMKEESSNLILLGDLFVCTDVVFEHCKKSKLQFEEQLKKTIAHGILHLFGYRHDSETEEREMDDIQNKYVQEVSGITKW